MFKKILVATDSVDVCDAPTALAADLAKQENAGLSLLHVLESPELRYRQWVRDFRSGKEIAVTAEYTETVRKTIADACTATVSGCKDYVIEAKPGFPWMEILKTARAMKPDLIVLGPHKGRAQEQGVVRMLPMEGLGSTAEAVIMRAHCPVMIVNRGMPTEKLAFKNVLFCTDFSATCQYAFELSLQVARRYGSKLHILHVLRIPRGERIAYAPEQVQKEMAKKKAKLEKTYVDQMKGIDYSVAVLEGTPAVQIKEYARSHNIDLIAIGSHVREQEKRWYVGSVVEQLGLESDCPVITVTRPEALLKFEE